MKSRSQKCSQLKVFLLLLLLFSSTEVSFKAHKDVIGHSVYITCYTRHVGLSYIILYVQSDCI